MIGFFRKIRKKLADDNKFFKYARYAIGEIALVVVGILIALSINNWNENRKKEKQLISNYHRILKETDYYKIRINASIKYFKLSILNNKKTLNLIKNKNPDSLMNLKDSFKGLAELISIEFALPVTTDFIKKDYQDKIYNKNLLDTLLELESHLSFLAKQHTYSINQYQLLIEPYLVENTNYSQIYADSFYVNADEDFDYTKFLDDNRLVNIANLKLETDVVNANYLNALIGILKKLENEIQIELEILE